MSCTGAIHVTVERLTASPIVLVADSFSLLKLTVFSCHLSGVPQSAAELCRCWSTIWNDLPDEVTSAESLQFFVSG
jgi:hypothetical protein